MEDSTNGIHDLYLIYTCKINLCIIAVVAAAVVGRRGIL